MREDWVKTQMALYLLHPSAVILIIWLSSKSHREGKPFFSLALYEKGFIYVVLYMWFCIRKESIFFFFLPQTEKSHKSSRVIWKAIRLTIWSSFILYRSCDKTKNVITWHLRGAWWVWHVIRIRSSCMVSLSMLCPETNSVISAWFIWKRSDSRSAEAKADVPFTKE